MKKTKLVSLLLAVVMLLSCFTAAFPVFASNEDVQNTVTLINAVKGKIDAETARPQAVAKYQAAVDAFNALSEDERNSFDVAAFSKLLVAVSAREIYLWKVENNSTSTTNAKKAAHERATKVLNMPAYVEEAVALYTAANGIKDQKTADEFLALLKNADENAIALAGCFNNTYKYFEKKASDKEGGKLLDIAAEKIAAVTMKSDTANKPAQPKYVSKPNPKKFADGENDPAYIAAYIEYLEYTKASSEYNAAKNAYETEKHYLGALKTMADVNGATAYAYETTKAALEGLKAFLETGSTEAKEFRKVYATLTEAQTYWLVSLDNYGYSQVLATDTEHGKLYSNKNYKLCDAVTFCANFDNLPRVDEFEAVVDEIALPYTNADIAKVKKAHDAVPSDYLAFVSDETNTKYKAILAAADKDVPSTEEPDLGAYNETQVSYKDISKENASLLADNIIALALKAAGVSDARELVNTKIFTNKTVAAISGWLYSLLDEATDGLISVIPSTYASKLTEEKFAGAAEALKAANNDWDKVDVQSGDFGFEDGDSAGFLDAVATIPRAAGFLLGMALKFDNSKNSSKGTYYGMYEDFIEIFETLDLKGVMSSDDFTAHIKSIKDDDEKFRIILAPIVSLLVDFGNNPINVINNVLPKLAYAIDSGIVDVNVNSLISKVSYVTLSPVDLSTSGIYSILNDKLLAPKGIKLSEDDFSELIGRLAGCGKAVSKPSLQSDKEFRLGIEADNSKTLVVLVSWILKNASKNSALVGSLLDMVTDNTFLKLALKLAIGASATFIPTGVVYMLVTILLNLAKIFSAIGALK